MSLPSQQSELTRLFGSRSDLHIVEVLTEAMSAKKPGRPVFADMLRRIEAGEADGIVSWAPDRLARNSIDGGRIVYLLDTGTIRDLKFATYTFENNSQGKFMLQIMFGQSKYYSDALSENVKRGNRAKIERGWRPNQPPLGYINDPVTRTVKPDPIRFPLIRQMFDLALTGNFSCRQIAKIAREEWGFRTPKKKRLGGKLLSMASMHRILTNPYYSGVIRWRDQIYPGRHKPIVTDAEFKRVQAIIRRPDRPRAKLNQFAYTGLIKCGGCGRGVTAEYKTNAYGKRYLYYHCSRRMLGPRCKEPAIQVQALEVQVATFLRSLACEPSIQAWVLDEIAKCRDQDDQTQQAQVRSREVAIGAITAELTELRSMRARGLISDQEFVEDRDRLDAERTRLAAVSGRSIRESIPLLSDAFSFSNQAAEWFLIGQKDLKRLILRTTANHTKLSAKILSIEAAKPFKQVIEVARCLSVRTINDDNPTKHATPAHIKPRTKSKVRRLMQTTLTELHEDPEGAKQLAENLAQLRELAARPREEARAEGAVWQSTGARAPLRGSGRRRSKASRRMPFSKG